MDYIINTKEIFHILFPSGNTNSPDTIMKRFFDSDTKCYTTQFTMNGFLDYECSTEDIEDLKKMEYEHLLYKYGE